MVFGRDGIGNANNEPNTGRLPVGLTALE